MITTAHPHKSGVIFYIIFKSFQKKFKDLRPKTTNIDSRGPALSLQASEKRAQKWPLFTLHAF